MKKIINGVVQEIGSVRGLLKVVNVILMVVSGVTCIVAYYAGMYPTAKYFEGVAITAMINAILSWDCQTWATIYKQIEQIVNKHLTK